MGNLKNEFENLIDLPRWNNFDLILEYLKENDPHRLLSFYNDCFHYKKIAGHLRCISRKEKLNPKQQENVILKNELLESICLQIQKKIDFNRLVSDIQKDNNLNFNELGELFNFLNKERTLL